ncbi:MAG TPA: radical SAM protein [Candidatus Deferrimicrobiaceae bacterium]
MIEIAGFSMVLTRRCNVSCRHCGFECNDATSETMTRDEAMEYIGGAASIPSLRIVSFTGGEPFLEYDLLRDLVVLAGRMGISSEVVTNGSWAATEAGARKRLEPLARQGLVNFVTSLDDFHLEQIPVENIGNAVKAAAELGLNVTVKTTVSPGYPPSPADPGRLLKLDPSRKNVRCVSVPLVPVGRAKRAPGQTPGGGPRLPRKALGGRCDKVIRFPTVFPGGAVFPCCGFGEGARLAGVAGEIPFPELLCRLCGNLSFNLLGVLGPQEIWEAIRGRFPTLPDRAFSSPCEQCNFLYLDPDALGAFDRWMGSLITPIS